MLKYKHTESRGISVTVRLLLLSQDIYTYLKLVKTYYIHSNIQYIHKYPYIHTHIYTCMDVYIPSYIHAYLIASDLAIQPVQP